MSQCHNLVAILPMLNTAQTLFCLFLTVVSQGDKVSMELRYSFYNTIDDDHETAALIQILSHECALF
jgi:hypothetical protein